jgi:hypothetical protein
MMIKKSPYELVVHVLKSFAEGSTLKISTENNEEFLRVCSRNRLLPVVCRVLEQTHLEDSYRSSAASSLLHEHEIRKIFNRFDALGIKAILLRGLYLGLQIYKDPALRPFADIDLLIEKRNIERAKRALGEIGYSYSPLLFPEEIFLEVHLHLLYFQPKHGIRCEVHWAIDHPFTTYDIKMKEIFETSAPIDLQGIHCFDIRPELRFILLLVHVQKHLPSVKYLYDSPDVLQHIIDNGELLHVLDAYLFLKTYSTNFDWHLFVEKAIEWNVDGVMYSTLRTLQKVFDLPLPDEIFAELLPPARRPMERFLAGSAMSRIGSNRLISRIAGRLVFTPKRLPDLYAWFFPDRRTIMRRHRVGSRGLILWYYMENLAGCVLKILNLLVLYAKIKKDQDGRRKKAV